MNSKSLRKWLRSKSKCYRGRRLAACGGKPALRVASIAAALTAVVALGCMPPAQADQLWNPELRDRGDGLPAGMLPPPGAYFSTSFSWLSWQLYDSHGKVVPHGGISSLAVGPSLLWVTPWKVLGASYAMGIAQPFDYTEAPGLTGFSGAGNWGIFNTVLIPGLFSWSVGNHVSLSAGLAYLMNDASSTFPSLMNGRIRNGGVPSGQPYNTAIIPIGISWLDDGWDASASLNFAFPLRNTVNNFVPGGYDYETGPELDSDFQLTKALGKWTAGVVAHYQHQLSDDVENGMTLHVKALNFGVGPLIGYNFGHVSFFFTATHDMFVQNNGGGNTYTLNINTRL